MTAQRRTTRRLAVGTAFALSVMLTALSPLTAAAVPDRGDHGAQAQCRYASAESTGWSGSMRLNRLTIQPPTLYSVAAPGEVGWRFIVQRSYDSNTWTRIFTSLTQRASATPSQAASFSALSAYINSPVLLPDGQGGYLHADYRAVLQFKWYADDGSIERSESHRVQFYDVLRDGAYFWTDAGDCSHAWAFI